MLIEFVKECVANYVVTCNPGNKVPASEVIVKTVTDTLAVTGGIDVSTLGWIAGFLGIGAILLFIYNDLRKRDRNNDE
jgi:hypothetical protein